MNQTTLIKCMDILWYGVVIGFAVMIYTVIMATFFNDFAYSIQSLMFNISKETFDQVMFYWIALFKLLWFVFFVIPYASIWLVLKKNKG
jgi:hypothetical protein